MPLVRFDPKNSFRTLGILTLIFVVLFLVDFLFVRLSHPSYTTDLAQATQNSLNETLPPEYGSFVISEEVPVPSLFHCACSLFKAKNEKTGATHYALIMRVTTLAGPMNAVYLQESDGRAKFVSCTGVKGLVQTILNGRPLNYYLKKANEVFKLFAPSNKIGEVQTAEPLAVDATATLAKTLGGENE